MSDDEIEIIERIEDTFLYSDLDRRISKLQKLTIYEDGIKDIKKLLDLYNKEKEKREIAEENHKVLSLDLGQALKELGLYEDTIIADELVLEINKKYISKDKIEERIKNLEISLNDIEDDLSVSASKYDTINELNIKINILQELLEERN